MYCKHFGVCGGCNNPLNYKEQLEIKIKQTTQALAMYLSHSTPLEVFASPKDSYRARAEFRIYRVGDEIFFAMNALDSHHKVPIDSCPILRPILQNLMPLLRVYICENEFLKHKLYACNLLCSLNDEVIITLIYHKSLQTQWEEAANMLQMYLRNVLKATIHIIGISKNQKRILSSRYIRETFSLFRTSQTYHLLKQAGAFSQPHPIMNGKMLEFVKSSLHLFYAKPSCDALELYCGGGNFTLILAGIFHRVFATEVVKSAITLLKMNMAYNHIENIIPARLNAYETMEAISRKRRFFRLKDIDIESFDFDCVLVDPPRSGIGDKAILCFLQRFSSIVYISCNPHTFACDMEILSQTHIIVRSALFDQFPYTFHIESICILRKK